jgi:hypothetical protein
MPRSASINDLPPRSQTLCRDSHPGEVQSVLCIPERSQAMATRTSFGSNMRSRLSSVVIIATFALAAGIGIAAPEAICRPRIELNPFRPISGDFPHERVWLAICAGASRCCRCYSSFVLQENQDAAATADCRLTVQVYLPTCLQRLLSRPPSNVEGLWSPARARPAQADATRRYLTQLRRKLATVSKTVEEESIPPNRMIGT